MTTYLTTAQVAAAQDPNMGQMLNALSRLRGRADALEEAIAARDPRARLRTFLELADIVEELANLNVTRAA
jgi:hypothetical protein